MTGHVEPTQDQVRALQQRGVEGPVQMLNLLRFREVADYTRSPELAPDEPLSGAEAYAEYSRNTMPRLADVGAEVVWMGRGGAALIGPGEERWDLALLVRYPSVAAFLSMTSDPGYLAGVGHRTAAVEDSRLVPLEPTTRVLPDRAPDDAT